MSILFELHDRTISELLAFVSVENVDIVNFFFFSYYET